MAVAVGLDIGSEAVRAAVVDTGKSAPVLKKWADIPLPPGAVVAGEIVDEGAVGAIEEEGKSLLAAGVVSVAGDFARGDAIEVQTIEGRVIGKGIANYNRARLERVKGLRSGEIGRMLGGVGEEVIHRDLLVVYKNIFG